VTWGWQGPGRGSKGVVALLAAAEGVVPTLRPHTLVA
jgi:hypothetical protein